MSPTGHTRWRVVLVYFVCGPLQGPSSSHRLLTNRSRFYTGNDLLREWQFGDFFDDEVDTPPQ